LIFCSQYLSFPISPQFTNFPTSPCSHVAEVLSLVCEDTGKWCLSTIYHLGILRLFLPLSCFSQIFCHSVGKLTHIVSYSVFYYYLYNLINSVGEY
jgi:hypothetical protein